MDLPRCVVVQRCAAAVGYQNKEVADGNAGGNTWCLATLPSVGVAKNALALSAWKVTPPEGGLWGDHSVCLTTFNAGGQIEGTYLYLDDMQCSMFSVDPGWYTAESVENWSPESADAVVIAAGEMFQINSDCGATMTIPSALK